MSKFEFHSPDFSLKTNCYAVLWIFPNSNPASFHGSERTTPLYCHWLQQKNTT